VGRIRRVSVVGERPVLYAEIDREHRERVRQGVQFVVQAPGLLSDAQRALVIEELGEGEPLERGARIQATTPAEILGRKAKKALHGLSNDLGKMLSGLGDAAGKALEGAGGAVDDAAQLKDEALRLADEATRAAQEATKLGESALKDAKQLGEQSAERARELAEAAGQAAAEAARASGDALETLRDDTLPELRRKLQDVRQSLAKARSAAAK